jgi:hypothetical protein
MKSTTTQQIGNAEHIVRKGIDTAAEKAADMMEKKAVEIRRKKTSPPPIGGTGSRDSSE